MPAHHSGGLMLDPRNDIAEGDATGCHAQWPQPAGLPCTDGTADRGGKPLVSCLCVTRGRVALLRRSVACFLSQTYTPCELVIVYGADDLATRDFVGTLNSPWIRGVAAPELTLGASRNLAVACSRGRYVACWDDDDWHAPDRLRAQLDALRREAKAGCVLERLTIFDLATESARVSHRRCWEGSLLALREAMPPYPEIPRTEDTPVVTHLLEHGGLALLDAPELYIYVYHGCNTWGRRHWDGFLLRHSQSLPPELGRQVMAKLGADDAAEWAERKMAASAAAESQRTWIDKVRKRIAECLRAPKRGAGSGERGVRIGESITGVGRIGNPSNCRTDCQSVLQPSPPVIDSPVLSRFFLPAPCSLIPASPRIVALYKTYDGEEWIEASLAGIYPHVARIVLVHSDTDWCGQKGGNRAAPWWRPGGRSTTRTASSSSSTARSRGKRPSTRRGSIGYG